MRQLTNEAIVYIVIISIIIIILAMVGSITLYRRFRRNKIAAESRRLLALNEINSRYSFIYVPDVYLSKSFDTKPKFDRFDEHAYATAAIMSDVDFFRNVIEDAQSNQKLNKAYLEEVRDIYPSEYSNKSWARVESILFNDLLIKPNTEPSIIVSSSYTSPAGRNHYEHSVSYDFDAFCEMFGECLVLKKQRSTRKVTINRERALMTDSIRYDVMRRDGFKCVLCGSSVSDGVKLEVDHIVPVSKGGKTAMSNLRTLCDRCNRGKRDKLES